MLSITSWSVDLMGLAIEADMSGVSLAGGLLKTVDGESCPTSGMLVGRFATYGLSVFGGYSDATSGHASFFIFGAINGPIGGPRRSSSPGWAAAWASTAGWSSRTDISSSALPVHPGPRPRRQAARADGQLQRLSGYFPHRSGNFWFAAGI